MFHIQLVKRYDSIRLFGSKLLLILWEIPLEIHFQMFEQIELYKAQVTSGGATLQPELSTYSSCFNFNLL